MVILILCYFFLQLGRDLQVRLKMDSALWSVLLVLRYSKSCRVKHCLNVFSSYYFLLLYWDVGRMWVFSHLAFPRRNGGSYRCVKWAPLALGKDSTQTLSAGPLENLTFDSSFWKMEIMVWIFHCSKAEPFKQLELSSQPWWDTSLSSDASFSSSAF